MVDCGVAKKLNVPVWMDRQGNVCKEEGAFGCQVFNKLVRPDMCICGDKGAGNLLMKGDRYIAGKNY